MNQIFIAGAVVAALVVSFAVFSEGKKAEGRAEGQKNERARVENEGKKIDAKARAAKRVVADTPASRVLDPWYRD